MLQRGSRARLARRSGGVFFCRRLASAARPRQRLMLFTVERKHPDLWHEIMALALLSVDADGRRVANTWHIRQSSVPSDHDAPPGVAEHSTPRLPSIPPSSPPAAFSRPLRPLHPWRSPTVPHPTARVQPQREPRG